MEDIAYGLHEISVTSTPTEFYLNNTDTRTMLIRGLGFCVLFLSLSLALQAQCDDSVDHYCHDSRIICDPSTVINEVFQMNDTTCFSQDTVIKCLGIWDINFDNPYWFRFTTTGSTLDLEFLIDNCMAGSSGIQYALLRDCDYDDTLECVASNGGAPFGIEGIITISEAVDPGETYALVIDGFGGSVCEISFNNIQGVGTIFLDPISSIQQFDFPNDTICQGAQNILFDLDFPPGSNIDFADLFIWTLSYEGMEQWDSITIDSNLIVDFEGLAGNYELCAYALNSCDTTNVVCTNFYLEELSDQVLDTFRFCISDLPLGPDDPDFMLADLITTINPNPAVFPIVNGYGCVFNQIVPLDPLSDSNRFFLDTAFCGSVPVTLMGQEYTTDQENLNIVLDGMASNGCDSLITLNLAFIDFDGSLFAENCLGATVDIEFIENMVIPANADTVIYHWTNSSGDIMTNVSNGGQVLTVDERDTFHLEVMVNKFGTECIKNFEIYAEPSMGELSLTCDSIGLNGIRFLWNDIDNSDGYQIWINSIDQGITNDTSYLLTGLSPDEFVNFEVEVLTSGFCPGPNESIICQSNSCPAVNFVLSPMDTSYCITPNMADINFQADFSANPFGGTGVWSGPFIDPNSGVFSTNLAGEGTFKLFYTFDQNGCTYIDSVSIIAKPTPTIEMTADTLLCVDDQLNIQVDGSFNSMASFNWELGTATLTGTEPGPFQVSWPIAGNYEIKLQLDQSSCLSNRDSIQVKVEPEIVLPSLSCDGGGSLDSLYFEWNNVECVSSFRVVIDNEDKGIQTDTFYILENLLPDQEVVFELTAISDCICNDETVQVICSTEPCPIISTPVISCDGGGSLDSLYFEWPTVWCTDNYRVFIDNVDMGIQSDTFYVLDGLLPDQLVNFRVVALNECLCEDVEFEVDCSTAACPIISTPVISCDGGGSLDSLYFEWPVVWCSDSYQVFIDNVDMGIQSDTFYILEGLLPDQLVNFRVVALNECLCEDVEFEVDCSTAACPIFPEPIIFCDGGNSRDSLYFEWPVVWCTDNYQVFIDNVDMGIQSDTFYILEGLLPDQLVNFRVVALNECLCEDVEFEVNCSTTPCPVIPEPVISCDGGGSLDSLYFEWPVVWCTDNYQVFIDNVDMGIQSDTFYILEGLLPDQLVNFRVVALNECLCEDVEFEVDCSTMECPNIPLPNFLCQGSTDSLYFEWTSVSCATNYQVFVDDVDMGTQTDTFIIIENLMPEQLVKFEIIALNECLCPNVVLIENCMTESCPMVIPPLMECEGTTTSIDIDWPQVWCTDSYQVFIDGIDKGIQSDTFYKLENLLPDQEVDIRIVAINECACNNIEIIEKCYASACPPISLQIDSMNDLCENELNGTMQFNVQVSGSDGTGFGFWSGEGIDSSGLFDPVQAGIGNHRIYYQFREVACTYVDSTEINIFQNPMATFDVEPPICPGDELAIVDISASGGDGDYLYELGTSSRMDGYFDEVMVGTHPIVIVDGNGCIFDTSVVIELPTIPVFSISGPDIVQENSGFTLELTGDVDWPEIDSIQWLKNGSVVPCDNSGCDLRFEDIATEESVYCAVVFYKEKCTLTSCFPLAVKKNLNLFIPNVINPTSPLFNNQFTVFSNDQLQHVNYIRVFDRWGEMMWEANDFIPSENANIAWDGQFNGEIVNPGVYIYMIEIVDIYGNIEKYSGDLTIIR